MSNQDMQEALSNYILNASDTAEYFSKNVFTQANRYLHSNEPVAAEVPPIRITHRDWLDIQKVIVEIGTLSKRCRHVQRSLIRGEALDDVADLAVDLMQRLDIKDEELS